VLVVPEEKESNDLKTNRDDEETIGLGAATMPDESVYIDAILRSEDKGNTSRRSV